jgi:hypothetical protein
MVYQWWDAASGRPLRFGRWYCIAGAHYYHHYYYYYYSSIIYVVGETTNIGISGAVVRYQWWGWSITNNVFSSPIIHIIDDGGTTAHNTHANIQITRE